LAASDGTSARMVTGACSRDVWPAIGPRSAERRRSTLALEVLPDLVIGHAEAEGETLEAVPGIGSGSVSRFHRDVEVVGPTDLISSLRVMSPISPSASSSGGSRRRHHARAADAPRHSAWRADGGTTCRVAHGRPSGTVADCGSRAGSQSRSGSSARSSRAKSAGLFARARQHPTPIPCIPSRLLHSLAQRQGACGWANLHRMPEGSVRRHACRPADPRAVALTGAEQGSLRERARLGVLSAASSSSRARCGISPTTTSTAPSTSAQLTPASTEESPGTRPRASG